MHTPGPWKYGIGLMVYDFVGRLVCNPSARRTPEETDANGYLIAAAPEMYDLLNDLMESAAYWTEYDVPIGTVDRMKAVLAKAKGGGSIMADQCKHCVFRGDVKGCETEDCYVHENWYTQHLKSVNDELVEALEKLLFRDEKNTCTHEETHRGGFIWEICDHCGAKWADDEGGKPEWIDPPEWEKARKAIAKAKGEA
jgi:hypothetical protein